MKGLNGLLDQW